MSSVLNSLNFRPSSESGKFSVVFFNQGRYSERRFQTKEQADDFAKYWLEKYSEPQWKHRPLNEWVIISEDPLYLRVQGNGDLVEYK